MFPLVFILKAAFIAYVFFSIVLTVILRLIGRYFKDTGAMRLYQMSQSSILIILLPVVMVPLLWFDAKVIEPNWIEVNRISVEAPHFHPKLKDVKIVQISDLHVEGVGYREKSLVRIVNDLHPDVILINGDFVNSREGWQPALEVLKQLKAAYGIYTILGNTDYYFANEKEVIPWLEDIHITVLRNDNLKLDFGEKGSFWLAGLSDKYGSAAQHGQDKFVGSAFKGIPLEEAKILLIHDPDHADVNAIAEYRPQLILAGDTHGGQFGIPFIRKFSTYAERSKYMAGDFIVNGIPLYVNRGIGMKTMYMRFLCRPEVTIIRLLGVPAGL